jgi:hypothetical protein
MLHILVLLARAGHGKTSIANYLRDTYNAQIVSLAGPLKRCAQKVMRFSDAQVYGSQLEKETVDPRYGMSAREFLQRLGTEGLREEFGQDIHVRALMHHIARLDEEAEVDRVYVVDDVRFPNEVNAVVDSESLHGACIKIICTDAPPTPNGGHASEAGIDLVYSEQIASTLVSSRAQGVQHLLGELEKALNTVPRLAPFRRALDRSVDVGLTPRTLEIGAVR